jgi:hypothetical protein
MSWHFRGTPYFLASQNHRIGLGEMPLKAAEKNSQIHRISTILAQLCQRFHNAPKDAGRPAFGYVENEQIKASLRQCEIDLEKLHLLAAAADAMMAEAYQHLGIEAPKRAFAVFSGADN